MTLESFYLICFLVGFLLSLVSFFGTSFHFHGHLPHFGDHGGAMHGGHAHGGHAHGGHAHGGEEISALNMMTATAFLAWFGGTGFLLQRFSGLWFWLIVALAAVSGLAGAWAVLWLLRKLLARERDLDPADYDMIGVLGRISSTVREGGVGELVFSQEGVRKASAVRSETGSRLEKGTEVIVTRYEKGIAYARRWDEALGRDLSGGN